MCARIWLKDGGSAKTEGRERKCGEKNGSLNALNNALAAHTNIKRERKERESAREKIELNSLILNYYLSIMGGMEPGRCAGED